jgi:hypothetical protein
MPDPKFHHITSKYSWHLYSINGKNEHWAVLKLKEQDQHKMFEAINRSGAQVIVKKMKSGAGHAIVITFSNDITLSAEVDKILPHLRAIFSLSPEKIVIKTSHEKKPLKRRLEVLEKGAMPKLAKKDEQLQLGVLPSDNNTYTPNNSMS